jgi:hypothetical protein
MRRVERPAEAKPEGRLAERALALTVAALVLLTPPILTIFAVPVTIVGIPLLYVYCFAIWLVAIALGGRLAMLMEPGKGPGDRTVPTSPDES